MWRSKWFWAVAGLAILAAFVYNRQTLSIAAKKKPKIAFVVGGPGPFWQQVMAGAKQATNDHPAELEFLIPEAGGDRQTAMILTLPAAEYDGVAVSPIEPDKQSRRISILAGETKVVTYDNDAPDSLRHTHVGTNNYVAGALCGELIKQAIPDGGKIALFVGDRSRLNAQSRHLGLVDALTGQDRVPGNDLDPMDQPIEAGDFTIMRTYLDGSIPSQAKENAAQALRDHPDLACMVGLYGYNGPMCLEALDEAGKLGQVQVVAFDQFEETLDGIKNGHIFATVAQDPFQYGYEAVRLLVQLTNTQPESLPLVGMGEVYLPCLAVDRENLEEFRNKLKSQTTSVSST